MDQALGGGVTRSLALDAHGKSLSSALLDLDIEPRRDANDKRRQRERPTIMPLTRHLPPWPPISRRPHHRAQTGRGMSRQDCRSRRRGRAHLHPRRQGRRARGGGRDGPAAQGAMPRRRAYAGIPVSIKDLFDIKGQVTRAGSRALEEFRAGGGRCARGGAAAPGRLHRDRPHQHDRVRLFRHRHQSALRHAEKRLESQRRPRARRLVLGRGGLGRRSAWPMARSAPIPAAPAGFRRPLTASSATSRRSARVPLDGGVPLSFSLDSFGPLARTVGCCAVLDAVLADEAVQPLQPRADQGHAACGADHDRARRSRRRGREDLRARAGNAVARRAR